MPLDMPPARSVGSTLTAEVAEQLRDMIRRGELAPGTKLRQVELASRLGVSTTPVREAFRTLTRERLVIHDAQRGVVVFTPSQRDVRENYEMRCALEPLAAAIAAEHIDPASLESLNDVLKRMRRRPKPPVYQGLNRQFHRVIYAAADRPRLFETIESLRDAFEAYALLDALAGPRPAYMDAVHGQHEAISRALHDHDAPLARELMAEHLQYNAAHFMAGAPEHPPATDRSEREAEPNP